MLLNMMKRNDAVYTFPVKKKNRFDRLDSCIPLYSVSQDFVEAV